MFERKEEMDKDDGMGRNVYLYINIYYEIQKQCIREIRTNRYYR